MSLKGLRVVEFARGIAGPQCAVRLRDLGANVTKLELREGDWMRGAPPELSPSGGSAIFFALNRGKRSVALGTKPSGAAPLLRRMLEAADVFISDGTTAELAAFGLDHTPACYAGINSRLIFIDISAFGRRGPWSEKPGSELTAQAAAGYTRYLGAYDRPARRLGADVAGAATAIFATQAVLAALLWRGRSGKGQTAGVSLLNSLLSMKSIHLAAQSNPDTYEGQRVGGANYPPDHGWRTADAPITFSFGGSVGAEGRAGWVDFVREVGLERLLDDPRFDKTGRTSTGLGERATVLKPEYERAFVNFPAATIVELVRKHGGMAAVYQSHMDAVNHAQTQALDAIREIAQPDGSRVKALAFPARFSNLPLPINGSAPGLGAHTEEVARELGFADSEILEMARAGALYVPAAR